MFTGIVREKGRLVRCRKSADGALFTIACSEELASMDIGGSIAVDGVCLTVVETAQGSFTVEATPETLRLSNLGTRSEGDAVNLEPPSRVNDFLGGHLVQGHVDQTGTLLSVCLDGNSQVFRFSAPEEIMNYCTYKGSITVNGVSLTVSGTGKKWFEVTIIPHTLEVTNFSTLGKGDAVNLEADVISKYVESHVKRLMTMLAVIFIFSVGLLHASSLSLGPNTVLTYQNTAGQQTSKFVVRLARYRPDIVLEWESAKDQGTLHLFQKAVEEGRKFTLTQLFEVGVDMESTDEMTFRLSSELYQDLLKGGEIKLAFNRTPAKMKVVGASTYSMVINQETVELPAIQIEDSRKGKWVFLKDAEMPLVLAYESPYFSQKLTSVVTQSDYGLRWIQKLPPVR